MRHTIFHERCKADDGNMSTIAPVCTCGWRGFGVAAYNDDQLTKVRKQGERHLESASQIVVANAA